MSAAIASAPIAALRGGPGSPAPDILAAFALRRKAEGVAVVGLISPPAGTVVQNHNEHAGEDHACECRGALLDLSTGELISIHQDLGAGSQSCNLDSSALAHASGGVERAIAAGAELVVLNRFGGQEAMRGGLMAVFQAAVAAGLPVVCTVAPKVEDVWQNFAEGMAQWVAPDAEALEAWWQTHAATRRQAA